MKIFGPPGLRADDPPLSSEPFWIWARNIRWVNGFPETIGMYAHLHTPSGEDMVIPIVGDAVSVHEDRSILIFGSDDTVSIVDWEAGTVQSLTITEAGSEGRWWFDSSGEDIIAGRGDMAGNVVSIDRTSGAYAVIPNSPMGAQAGGIIGGILVFAGLVESFDTNNPKMLVRWSARNTDPVSPGGDAGFENWTPSDTNASGEALLEGGSCIVGGGPTDFGFVVWSDTTTHLLAPRADSYIFDVDTVFDHGLLAVNTWVQMDGLVWWFDQSRDLCVMDGGRPRVLSNPLKKASIGTINDADLENCTMSAIRRYGEVILNYRGFGGALRQLVYNYKENAWYHWRQDRLVYADENARRPVIALASDGQLHVHELRIETPAEWLNPIDDVGQEAPALDFNRGPLEPLDFMLSTNNIIPDDPVRESMRAMSGVFNHSIGWVDNERYEDTFLVTMLGYGEHGYSSPTFTDQREFAVGEMFGGFRLGGKSLRLIYSSEGVRTNIRFGPADVTAGKGGQR